MTLPFVTISVVLISLTNFVVIPLNGLAPITAFILFAPVLFFAALQKICNSFPDVEEPIIYLPGLYLLTVAALNLGHTRWSSIAYSMLYFTFFIAVNGSAVSRNHLSAVCKLIIGSYLANVIAAQALYLVAGDLGAFQSLLQGTYDLKTETMRFHGFSSEPSYAAFVVVVALIAYSRVSADKNATKLLWFGAVWYLLASFSSVYGYLLLGAFAVDWILKRKLVRPTTIAVLVIAAAVAGLAASSLTAGNGETRVVQLMMFLVAGGWNLQDFRSVDASAFMRIGPFLLYLTGLDLFSSHAYLGHGPGAAATYFGDVFSDAIGADLKGFETGTMNLGFFPGFLYDYGLFGVALVLLVVLRRGVSGFASLESAVFLLLLPNANLNTQLFWYVWGMFYLMNQCTKGPDGQDSNRGKFATAVSP
jgi:hypothetical protein